MENLESYKDIRTIASVSALVGMATMSIYFQNKISKIETDLEEVQKHLAAVVPCVDPNSKHQLEQVIKALRVLDSQVASTQNDLKVIVTNPIDDQEETIHEYVRLTKPPRSKHCSGQREYSRTTTLTSRNKEKVEDNYDDLNDDVAMMMT